MTSAGGRPGEFELIDRYFRPLAGAEGLGLRDDVALLAPEPGFEIAVTVDGIVEGIDFFPDDPPEAVAAKALRINISDLAAKGAEPFAYLVALNLSDGWSEQWVARFAAGLAREQGLFGANLIGGDLGRGAERISVSVTAFGRLPAGTLVARSGAAAGDAVFVSGTIGDSALGLGLRRAGPLPADPDARHLVSRYLYPQPRTALAPVLRRFATAAMDVSDGLAGDLMTLCAASGVSAAIDVDAVPLSAPAAAMLAADPALIEPILTGGDDYEILFTAPAERRDEVLRAAEAAGVPCAAIGTIVEGGGPPRLIRRGADLSFARPGHDHFR